ncbi:alternative oxidase [Drepanopeziza brunnea f. sp. 'multigermtubi' MB_m1]|uniref:Alternative oxidase n=1 Tax=Marssonina brunnea f. sp. multigermtubi (strain MB_m1) TaxID=1072389 RepID=K1XIP8_MARBU|nr:alternative oxidase [Drepanopeziza brunnea f. sp. 'multigermtubi' MB_m1]EKD20583.1 alternative oxidase [Drepanopeziza brunnea f. sp. 'multigermtubi' MB_m1]
MFTPSSLRCFRISKFLFPAAFIVLLLTAYLFNFSPGIRLSELRLSSSKDSLEAKSRYIQEAAEWEIDGPFNDSALRDLCSSKEWTPSLTFRCDDSFGGVGNLRNMILTCIRYAIEAGATGLVVPQIKERDKDLKELTAGKTLPFTYMFDEDFFITSLSTACPQMKIIRVEDLVEPAIKAAITPKDLGTKFRVVRIMDFPSEWRGLFDQWLVKYGHPGASVGSVPILVTIRPSWFQWPILHDDPLFTATFGRILRFEPTFLKLAATTLYAFNQQYGLGIEARKTGVPDAGKFYGAHLRTAVDAVAAKFASYDEQSKAYLAESKKKNFEVIYVASGSPPDIERFSETAATMGMNVTTKSKILRSDPVYADTLNAIEALTWDQQALIDYMVLLRSSHFGGTWASSFSYNIVFKRHVAVDNGQWTHSDLALKTGVSRRSDPLEEGECYHDQVSTIFGRPGHGLWFEMSMWP